MSAGASNHPNTDARKAMLGRIRRAWKDQAPLSRIAINAEWEALPRAYDQVSRLSLEASVDLLEDRLRDYDAEVTRVTDEEVAVTIAGVLAARANRSALLPQGFPMKWIPVEGLLTGTECAFTFDQDFSPRQLDHFDAIITGASIAIAETGTLVLQNVAGQGRRAGTLVPDFHLCVLRMEDIVENVPDAFARLALTSTLPITFVSGPSATADIEMTRIKGVHGPRFLHVLIVTG